MIRKYSIISLLITCVMLTMFAVGCADNSELFDLADESRIDVSDMHSTEYASDIASVEYASNMATPDYEDAGSKNSVAQINERPVADQAEPTIIIYICGHVSRPGIYELPANSRVYEAINAAGGLLSDAALEVINQAEVIYDGQKIYVPSQKEMTDKVNASEIKIITNPSQGISGGSDRNSGFNVSGVNSASGAAGSTSRININTASAEELTKIPGIGNTKASAIVSYRQSGGRFDSPQDITNVSGIGPSTYEKIKDYISVK